MLDSTGFECSGKLAVHFYGRDPVRSRCSSTPLFNQKSCSHCIVQHRFSANALMYFFALLFSGFGPAVSKVFILHTDAGWRWCYYLMIMINFASGVFFLLFYFPPTFSEKFKDRSKWQQIKDIDYIDTFLFLSGFLTFPLGLPGMALFFYGEVLKSSPRWSWVASPCSLYAVGMLYQT